MTKSSHVATRELAAGLRRQAVRAGVSTPAVRGASWYRAVVDTVGSDGTITTTDGITALRDERYQAPASGDVIRVSISASGAAVAEGRLAAPAAPSGQWAQIPLASGFAARPGLAVPQYRIITAAGQPRVELQGGINPDSAVTTQTEWSTALPVEARPPYLRTFVVRRGYSAATTGSVPVEINTAGVFSVFGSNPPSTTWFSIDCCYYDL